MSGYVVEYPDEQGQPNVNVYAGGVAQPETQPQAQGQTQGGPSGKWRKGNITVTKWTNQRNIGGRQVPVDNFVIERIYKDQQGNWKTTKYLDRNDLVRLYFLLGEVLKEVL